MPPMMVDVVPDMMMATVMDDMVMDVMVHGCRWGCRFRLTRDRPAGRRFLRYAGGRDAAGKQRRNDQR